MPVGQRRVSSLPELTDKQLRDAQKDLVYIFNVSPKEYQSFVERFYRIPARKSDGEVSEPLVIPGQVYSSYSKGGEPSWDVRDGIDVARDIVGLKPFMDQSQDLTRFGVFISMTAVPASEDVEKATQAWLNTCSNRVNQADSFAAMNNGMVDVGNGKIVSNIGDQHREALKELGLTRTWSGKNQRMVECTECGVPHLPSASMCKGCDAIFNEAEARRLYPQKFPEPTRGPSRPRNEVVAQ